MRASLLLLLVLAACSRDAPPPVQPAPAPPGPGGAPAGPQARVEDEVLANLRAEPCGAVTIAELALPEPFLRRVADRVIRATYWERFRVIVADGKPAEPAPAVPEGPPPPVRVRRHADPMELAVARAAYTEGAPERRGFRARYAPADSGPVTVDTALVPRDLVARTLASEGLLATTARVIAELGARSKPVGPATLEAAGLPVDWLECFSPPEGVEGGLLAWIEGLVRARLAPEALADQLRRARFAFVPGQPGFRVASESGELELDFLRVQLTRGDHWDRQGDGGSVDLVRECVERLPAVGIVASLHEAELERFLRTASTWNWGEKRNFDLVLEPAPLAQWAQDNAKPGHDEQGELTLLPRFASRGELGASLVPGESFALEGFAALGHRIAFSRLAFQGGNLLCCTRPGSGERLLLVGEAEVHRNTSLGLTQAQVLEALRAEFGVARCIVLPAVGFHLDVEVSVRAVGDTLVAFVNDQLTAVQLVLECGLEALRARGLLPEGELAHIRDHLGRQELDPALKLIVPRLEQGSPGPGQFSEGVARAFCAGPGDNGPGNMLRFLAALDFLAGIGGGGDSAELDPHTAAYLRSFARREHDRFVLARGLENLGFKIVPVPGFPEDTLGITPLNGIHEKSSYLFPAYGGIYRPLDLACERILANVLGPEVKIVPVHCAESQRRGGALHCAAVAYGRVRR